MEGIFDAGHIIILHFLKNVKNIEKILVTVKCEKDVFM